MASSEKATRTPRRPPRRDTADVFGRLELTPESVVSVEAAQVILSAIATGRLRAGDKLPPERELSTIFGISRASLRDALKMLSGMGAVRIRRSDGVFVSGHDDRVALSEKPENAVLVQRGSTAELFELREVLETQAAGWAAMRASDAQIVQMQTLHAKLERKAKSGKLSSTEARALDGELHRAIARSTSNRVLVQVMDTLRDLLTQSRNHTTDVPGRMAMSVDEIGRVITAIRDRDPVRAQQAMFSHLKMGEQANMLSAARLVGNGETED